MDYNKKLDYYNRKLNRAYDIIIAYTQWFTYHNFAIEEDIREKLDRFYEVKDED